jgi:hypothetical protein
MITLRDIKEKILSKIDIELSVINVMLDSNINKADTVKSLSEAYKILNDIKED